MTIFDEVRPVLFALAYRMLGSQADAEDIVQDAYLRWQAVDQTQIVSAKSYLTTIVARLALDQLKSARRQRETYVGTWLPEPLVNDPTPDKLELAESLSLAFLHVLESLTPPERAAFLLREVFEADYSEVAGVLETTEANSRQLVSRARQHLQERRPRFTVDRETQQRVLNEFLAACGSGDLGAIKSMLREDAISYSDGGGVVSAGLNPIYGADRIVRLLEGLMNQGRGPNGGYARDINGEPGFVFTRDGATYSVLTLDLDETGRIRAMYSVLNPDKLEHIETADARR